MDLRTKQFANLLFSSYALSVVYHLKISPTNTLPLISRLQFKMAGWCKTSLCYLLILLFVTNEVFQTTEARKVGENFKCTSKCMDGKLVTEGNGTANTSQEPASGVNTAGGDVDAFRPTNPGHSPGVGHSIHV
ncbi:hypothetical protein L1887_31538 [Cichorium endivia]|nr:hypothetical protein L1887_31538 [Cichorium endivia]